MKKLLTLLIIMGLLYLNIEVIYRALMGDLVGEIREIKYASMAGWTSLWMFFIGGTLGVALGLINEIGLFKKNANIFFQSLIGTAMVLFLEYMAGVVLNKWLNLSLWDYSDLPMNIDGQISLLFAVYWFFLCPLVFWMDDLLRYVLYKKGKIYHIKDVYSQLFVFWRKDEILQTNIT